MTKLPAGLPRYEERGEGRPEGAAGVIMSSPARGGAHMISFLSAFAMTLLAPLRRPSKQGLIAFCPTVLARG